MPANFPALRTRVRPVANGTTVTDLAVNEDIVVLAVTPEMASSWLANGGKNRKISRRRVAQYTRAMQQGEWRLTYEAVKLDRSIPPRVRDGQHRLTAIVESGCTIQMLVVYGVEEDAFDVMDRGAERSNADVLSIHEVTNSAAISAVVRFLVTWENDHRAGVYGAATIVVSAPQTLAYIEAHPDVGDWLEYAGQIHRGKLRGGPALWAGLLTLFGRIDHEQTEEFAEAVATGANLAAGSPMLTLRKQLINMPGSNRAATNRTACWIIKAWNAYRKGVHVFQLKWGQDEAFPEPE